MARIKMASDQESLEMLWALNAVGGLTEERARELLSNSDPYVRLWTARLMGDRNKISDESARAMAKVAELEPNVHVRSQIASSARRLSAAQDLAIVRALVGHREDASDPHIPLLLWWAVEAKVEKNADAILSAFADRALWEQPLIKEAVVDKLIRRFAQAGSRQDFLNCARLFELSPGGEFTQKLEHGFEEGVKGRSLAGLPVELMRAMEKAGVRNEALGVRLYGGSNIERGLQVIADPKTAKERRLRLIEAFGEVNWPQAAPVLTAIAIGKDQDLARAALFSLQRYGSPAVAKEIANALSNLGADSQLAALNLLATRADTSLVLLNEIADGKADAKKIPKDVIAKIRLNAPEQAQKIWGAEKRQTTGEMQVDIDRIAGVLATGSGSPYEGIKVFSMTCAPCHKLFAQGGQIGPDLTAFKRDDLPNMLLNIVNPNAEIREGYVNYLVTTKDGRAISGFLADEDTKVVVIRGIDGANVTLARAEIQEMKPAGVSLMPEGLLQALENQQVRDLFAYLRSTQPLVR